MPSSEVHRVEDTPECTQMTEYMYIYELCIYLDQYIYAYSYLFSMHPLNTIFGKQLINWYGSVFGAHM